MDGPSFTGMLVGTKIDSKHKLKTQENSADLSAAIMLGVPASPAVPSAPNPKPGALVDNKSTVPVAPNRKPPRDRCYASRRSIGELRAARRYVETLGSRPAESLTAEEKSKLSWARSRTAAGEAVPSGTEAKIQPAVAGPKRQPNKRQKRVINRPYSDVARDSLIRAIVDNSNSDGSISQEKWELIGQKLLDVSLQSTSGEHDPPPKCTDAGWFQGHVKLVKCADEHSANKLKLIIPALGEVWPGAGLQMVMVGEIPRRTRCI